MDLENYFGKKYGTCILLNSGTSVIPRIDLEKTKIEDSVTYYIKSFVQDQSQLIEYCGIVHYYVIVSVRNPGTV